MVPAHISTAEARLPQTYEAAKQALANCASIDECQNWANKAEALASYAKQADDDTLRRLADRIQGRAVRRCGELLKQFDGSTRNAGLAGTHRIPRYEVASGAGLSEHQTKTAVRVANIPEDDFESAIEGDSPPTVTKLAEMGKQTRPAPKGFKQATHAIGALRRFRDFCEENDAALVANGVMAGEAEELREAVATIDGWMDRFVVNLKG